MFLQFKKDRPFQPAWLYILSSIGGYPTGAALLKQILQKQVIPHPGLLFSALQFPSPMFLIGFVGAGVFQNIGFGVSLYFLMHLINGSLFIFWLSKRSPITGVVQRAGQSTSSFFLSLAETLTTIAVSVIVSSATAEVVTELFSLDGTSRIISYGLLELSSGIGLLEPASQALFLCVFFLGFSGLSVHLQNLLILRGESLSYRAYWLSRLLTMIVLLGFVYWIQ